MSETQPRQADRAVHLLSESQLRRIRRLIDENIGNDLSVSDLSSELKISASHFSRCFKATLGIPPHTFVVHCKIIEAARLVLETNGSLEEIAEKVGFSNLSYFRRRFRKLLGCNPSDLRIAAGLDPGHTAAMLSLSTGLLRIPGVDMPVDGDKRNPINLPTAGEQQASRNLTFE